MTVLSKLTILPLYFSFWCYKLKRDILCLLYAETSTLSGKEISEAFLIPLATYILTFKYSVSEIDRGFAIDSGRYRAFT